ncbi:MAG: extracellular solute-binding protein [Firmicutes bacterium]|nr:extracellular solute-binding protein [Bacillota bacterium]
MKKTSMALMALMILVVILTVVFLNQRQLLIGDQSVETPVVRQVDLTGTSFENYTFPEGFDIRKYEGITLNFIVENNLSANILSLETEEFTKLTGINIKIRPTDYDTFIQKINLDFISKAGDYQLIYSDPYQTLNRFHDGLEVLNQYMLAPDLPKLQVPISDFFRTQLEVCSYFETTDALYTIPFDSTTMVLYYRKDVFEDFKNAFMRDKGYDWTPGTEDFTWERYIEVAQWIDTYVPNEIVEFGSGQMAQAHNSIFCEFSNVLASNGGDYFRDENIGTLGRSSFDKLDVMSPAFVSSLDLYKRIVDVSAPASLTWKWEDAADAFSRGKIAMMLNWDENYAQLDNSSNFRVRGNVGTAILPYGTVRSANIYGGSGIGINKYASEEEKEAAWFFITWASSKDMQLRILTEPTGGALPTIQSAYDAIDPDFRASHPQIDTVLKAWAPENIYLRPKLENFYTIEQHIIEALHTMVRDDLDPNEVALTLYRNILEER